MEAYEIITLIFRLILLGSTVYLLAAFYAQYRENKFKAVLYLIYTYLAYSFTEILMILSIFLTQDPLEIIGFLDAVEGVVLCYFFTFFISYYEDLSLDPQKVAITSILGTAGIIFLAQATFLELEIPILELLESTYFVFFTYVLIILTNSLRRIYQEANEGQRKFIKYLIYYFGIGFGGVTLYYTVLEIENIVIEQYLTPAVPPLLFTISNVLLYLGYVRPRDPSILQPQKLQKLILMSDSGLPLFEHDFRREEEINSILLAGALTAINAVLKEATNMVGNLESVKIGNSHVMIQPRTQVTGVLFTSRPTPYLIDGLAKFMQSVEQSKPDLMHSLIDEDMDEILKKRAIEIFGN